MKFLRSLLDLPIFTKVETNKTCQILAWMFAFVAVGTVTGFLFVPLSNVYFAISVICLMYILTSGRKSVNGMMVALYITFGISTLLASDSFFNPKGRYLLFLLITLVCSPCISSPIVVAFRSLVFRNVFVLSSCLTIGSFVGYFGGINYMPYHMGRTDLVGNVTNVGIFSGLYTHSMLLGPFSAFTALLFLYSFLASRKKIYIAMFFMSAATVVLSASRAATLSLVVPIIFSLLFMKSIGDSKKKLIGLLVTVSIVAIPIADKFSTGVMQKQQGNIESGGTLNSRESKWNARIEEFCNHPVFGIGFCTVDKKRSEDYGLGGGVETGSTHLSILSMTGLVGFIPYFVLLFAAFKSIKNEYALDAKFRYCFFLIMITHATFEGYALYAGGFMCFLFWLSIALCFDYKYIKNMNCANLRSQEWIK